MMPLMEEWELKQYDVALWKSFGFVGSLPLATFLLSIALQVLQLSSFLHSAGGEDTIQSGRLTKTGRSSSGTDLLIRTTRSEISSK